MTEEDKLFRKRFFAFLKENNAYDKWRYYVQKQHSINGIWWWNDFYQTLYEDRCLRAINNAFNWTDTKEGYDFWFKIQKEWRNYRSSLI